ncbi:hypothetical protein PTKIN_Ptkin06aG0137900 [Pterospermum kingtungense]
MIRDLPPSHFLFRIESFSLLVKTEVEMYKSDAFDAGGHQWRLVLYPNGNQKNNGNGYISLYLEIERTENLSLNWEVSVDFKLFVHDQIRDKYLVFKDWAVPVRRFYELKTKWGFSQLLSQETFNDASNGFSDGKGIALSVYLELEEAYALPPNRKLFAEYKLRLMDQIKSNHLERKANHWFHSSSSNWGYPKFVLLNHLHDASKGYILNDNLIVEAEILIISRVKCFS